jgi:hypothetical protein
MENTGCQVCDPIKGRVCDSVRNLILPESRQAQLLDFQEIGHVLNLFRLIYRHFAAPYCWVFQHILPKW